MSDFTISHQGPKAEAFRERVGKGGEKQEDQNRERTDCEQQETEKLVSFIEKILCELVLF